jgi:hypothetical protein
MTTKELELSLTPQQRTILDYIIMEFLTVPESDSLTIDKLHNLMLFIVEEFQVVNWSNQVDSNHVETSKKFGKYFRDYILDIVN